MSSVDACKNKSWLALWNSKCQVFSFRLSWKKEWKTVTIVWLSMHTCWRISALLRQLHQNSVSEPFCKQKSSSPYIESIEISIIVENIHKKALTNQGTHVKLAHTDHPILQGDWQAGLWPPVHIWAPLDHLHPPNPATLRPVNPTSLYLPNQVHLVTSDVFSDTNGWGKEKERYLNLHNTKNIQIIDYSFHMHRCNQEVLRLPRAQNDGYVLFITIWVPDRMTSKLKQQPSRNSHRYLQNQAMIRNSLKTTNKIKSNLVVASSSKLYS